MKHHLVLAVLVPWIAGCGQEPSTVPTQSVSGQDPASSHGHDHSERSLGTVTVGGLTVELAQGHGNVTAGEQSHLVVKLPYTDKGSTLVRAWLGTEDRTLSLVGLGQYAASHDDYDIHAQAPDPFPPSMLWWFEIEKPDGSKILGSAAPLLK
ncbi:MAG: hypothetical protein QF412_05235 [Planctomycetota bacterium]|jgi:hypothetical protein|nr:hypothetical protein [Planctomycetota bacterium]